MAMTDDEWIRILNNLTPNEINIRIDALKARIRDAQNQLAVLVILQVAVERADEWKRISEKRANQAIDEAINRLNENSDEPHKIITNTEGGIKN